MRGRSVCLALAILLLSSFAAMAEAPEPVAITAEQAAAARDAPGAVLAVASGTMDDGGEMRPHLIEYHTAEWCAPCAVAEQSLDDTTAWWPTLAVNTHHSSALEEDIGIPHSRMLMAEQNQTGFPTLVIDGHWVLRGSTHSTRLSEVLTALSTLEADLDRDDLTNISLRFDVHEDVERNEAVLTWNLSAPDTNLSRVVVDVTVTAPMETRSGAGVVWMSRDITLHEGEETMRIDLDSEWNASELEFTVILRRMGTMAGEEPVVGGLQGWREVPLEVEPNRPDLVPLMVGVLMLLLLAPAVSRSISRMPVLLGLRPDDEEE